MIIWKTIENKRFLIGFLVTKYPANIPKVNAAKKELRFALKADNPCAKVG